VVINPAIPYSRVRGLVHGLQYGSTDAFSTDPQERDDINKRYVDGVSITAGAPRRHIWTFASGLSQTVPDPGDCPCVPDSTQPPKAVGSDYCCDSGNPTYWTKVWYVDHPLWSACQCGTAGFDVQVSSSTDPIEVRVMVDGCDENLGVTELQIEVR